MSAAETPPPAEYETAQLRSFLAVAQTRSFTRAAARLGIGQPAVSQHVRKLEEAAGRRFFTRDTHSVELTEDGEALIVDIEGYEGPLHVLLALARNQKVDLLKLSVLKLAEQYLAFVQEARKRAIRRAEVAPRDRRLRRDARAA